MSSPKKRLERTSVKTEGLIQTKAPKNQKIKKAKKHYNQLIFHDWCKACGICSAFCPNKVIGRDETGAPVIERPDACIGCRFCELHCPDFAITIEKRDKDRPSNSS